MSEFSYKFYRTTSEAAEAMREAILGAKSSIYWEIYSFIDDFELGKNIVDILCEKAAQKVEVKMVLDAIGSFELSRLSVARLRAAGVDVVFYNRLSPRLSVPSWWRGLWRRNHRKNLIIDESTVFIGGVNVGKVYSPWHDLHVHLTGQPVNILLRAFASSYIGSGGKKSRVKHLLRYDLKSDWKKFKNRYEFLLHSPRSLHDFSIRNVFLKTLGKTQKEFNLMTPYFVPDIKFFNMVKEAKNRGAQINLFLPLTPDWKFLEWVAGFYYRLAHRHGISVFLSARMNHGKAMTSDGEVGFVGSFNFTPRSFLYNKESGILFEDQLMVEELNGIFSDLKNTALLIDEKNYLGKDFKSRAKAWFGKYLGGIV